jgi:peptidoglycan/xylan/chitin deacetylase (PgdA/CDA1 family)
MSKKQKKAILIIITSVIILVAIFIYGKESFFDLSNVVGKEEEDQKETLSLGSEEELSPIVEPEPLPEPLLPEEREKSVPILMYHAIGESNGYYPSLYVRESELADHLDALMGQGYHTITMAELTAHWVLGVPLPSKPVVLTFDDGYRDAYTAAFPLLKERGMCAVFYIDTQKIDKDYGLLAEMIKEMHEAGMEIGSHTVHHHDLTILKLGMLKEELADSKTTLEELCGGEIISFCYPAGRNNAEVREAVAAAGYQNATTTQGGRAAMDDDIFALKRLRINRGDTGEGVLKKIGN